MAPVAIANPDVVLGIVIVWQLVGEVGSPWATHRSGSMIVIPGN
jgi:hypothetical protein